MSIQYLVRSIWSNSRLKTVKLDASTTELGNAFQTAVITGCVIVERAPDVRSSTPTSSADRTPAPSTAHNTIQRFKLRAFARHSAG